MFCVHQIVQGDCTWQLAVESFSFCPRIHSGAFASAPCWMGLGHWIGHWKSYRLTHCAAGFCFPNPSAWEMGREVVNRITKCSRKHRDNAEKPREPHLTPTCSCKPREEETTEQKFWVGSWRHISSAPISAVYRADKTGQSPHHSPPPSPHGNKRGRWQNIGLDSLTLESSMFMEGIQMSHLMCCTLVLGDNNFFYCPVLFGLRVCNDTD